MKHEFVQEMFSRAAERFSSNIAIESADRRFTYQDLEERSNQLANLLISSGASRGSIVAIIIRDSAEVIAAIIAVLKANCVFVPLDPGIPEKRLAAIIAESSPEWLLTELALLPIVAEITAAGDKKPAAIFVDGPEANLDFGKTERPAVLSEPDDMSYVYFTSGSTGRPKGIAGRLKAIDHFIRWEIKTLGIDETVRVSHLTTPSFDASLRDIFVPLCAGGTVCVPPGRETVLDSSELVSWIDSQRINVVHCVPSLFRSLISEPLTPLHFGALKYILLAGEPLLPSDVKAWMKVFGDGIQLVNLYGPSETTMVKFFYFVKAADQDRRSIPIGQPIEGAKALIFNSTGKVCPAGAVGEIYIRTPFCALGYLNQPNLTREFFIPNPFNNDPGDVVYKTGDLGRVLEDGNFEFLGRQDHQVKIRGVRVELGEIENHLLNHPGVSDVAVVDREGADGGKYLCAFVVANGETDSSTLRDYLARFLPDYLLPSAYVMMDALPRTITGKTDRRALPSLNQLNGDGRKPYIAPRTAIEQMLAGVWSHVLGIERIGIDDNFFDLGGHSLLVTRLLSRVRAAFDVDLPMRSLFEAPTVCLLARAIKSARMAETKAQTPPLGLASREAKLLPSYTQQRLWFLEQLLPLSGVYNIAAAIRIQGPLDVHALQHSFNQLAARHEVLRTTFTERSGEPVQVIATSPEISVVVVDVTGSGEAQREAEMLRLATRQAQEGFDLERGPLMRVSLLRLAHDHHVLVVTMHHIISDAWSMGVIVREVGELYAGYREGRESGLEEIKVQYGDYAAWQREWLEGEALDEQLKYWQKQLAGAPAVSTLPTDRPRPAVQSYRGATRPFTLAEQISDALRDLSRQEDVSLFITILTAFETLLHYYSLEEDLVIGIPVANRNFVELEPLIGLFLNTVVLRIDLSGDPDFRELLARVRDVTLAAYDHQDLPFGRLVEALQPDRTLNYNTLFQVTFTLESVPFQVGEIRGLKLSPVELGKQTSQFDLALNLTDTGTRLVGVLEYSTDLYEASTIEDLLASFEELLSHVVAHPEATLSELRNVAAEAGQRRRAQKEQSFEQARFDRLKTSRRRSIVAQ